MPTRWARASERVPARWRPTGLAGSDRTGPPTYLPQAIIVTLLFFWPTGICAIYFSSQVTRRLAVGDTPGALRSSRLARMFCLLSVGLGIVSAVVIVLYFPQVLSGSHR